MSFQFGAAVFVPVCVAGNVALAVPDAKVHRLSYLRDVIWLFCSVGFIWAKVCNERSVNFFESILMWILYALYVFSVIIAEFWRNDHPENAEDLADDAVLDAYSFYEARIILSHSNFKLFCVCCEAKAFGKVLLFQCIWMECIAPILREVS